MEHKLNSNHPAPRTAWPCWIHSGTTLTKTGQLLLFPHRTPDNTGHCPQVQGTDTLEQSLDMSKSSFLKARFFFIVVFILNYIYWDDIAWHVSYSQLHRHRVTQPREGSIVHTHNPRVLTPQNGVSMWGRLILVLYIFWIFTVSRSCFYKWLLKMIKMHNFQCSDTWVSLEWGKQIFKTDVHSAHKSSTMWPFPACDWCHR